LDCPIATIFLANDRYILINRFTVQLAHGRRHLFVSLRTVSIELASKVGAGGKALCDQTRVLRQSCEARYEQVLVYGVARRLWVACAASDEKNYEN
jgi:hypothetical protein